MESIKLDCLLGFATRTRQAAYQKGAEDECRATEVGPPIFGSYHLLYPVKFNDGVRWLLKVPADATRGKFTESNATTLRSHALTMRMLKRDTTIPLPRVFSFSMHVTMNSTPCLYSWSILKGGRFMMSGLTNPLRWTLFARDGLERCENCRCNDPVG